MCESLPSDYNTTAIRLQPLIGASDHMIEWILTGDLSQVNHRIYQVVLVFVCFEPHFIKFCDIMQVLAADSMTVGYIVELRQSKCIHIRICVCVWHYVTFMHLCMYIHRCMHTYANICIYVSMYVCTYVP